jgi:hypothetical protein
VSPLPPVAVILTGTIIEVSSFEAKSSEAYKRQRVTAFIEAGGRCSLKLLTKGCFFFFFFFVGEGEKGEVREVRRAAL